MAAGSTYSPIATTTLGSNSSSVTFSSLGSYTDLVLVISSACTADDNSVSIRFNSDTGSNYSDTTIRGNGSSASSVRNSSITSIPIAKDSSPTTTLGEHNIVCSIMNYGNSATYKTTLSRANRATSGTYTGAEAVVGLWRSSAAITSITILANFITGSTFTLYGIAAA
jgi:hypothetical protein